MDTINLTIAGLSQENPFFNCSFIVSYIILFTYQLSGAIAIAITFRISPNIISHFVVDLSSS